MAIYWLMFLIPLFALAYPLRAKPDLLTYIWWLIGIFYTLLIGFRFEVGGDWLSYLVIFNSAKNTELIDIINTISSDPGYALLNWLAEQLGGGIYLVNLVCGAIFMTGLISFCRRQPLPWLALLVAVPYMIIVLGMGYTRQSVAFGFELLALNAFMNNRLRHFVLLILCGALFHKSAVLLLPIAALAANHNRLLTVSIIAAVSPLMYYLLLEKSAESLWTNYVNSQMQSEGASIRVAMNALPAILLLLFRKHLAPDLRERRLWLWIAVFALACIPLVGMASTAVDRMALYLMPLQLYVFSRLHYIAPDFLRTRLILGIVVYYATVQFIWLNYASNAFYWVPYHFISSNIF